MGRSQEGFGTGDAQPLIPPSQPSLYAQERPRRDSIWAVLYALTLAGAVVGAVYGWTHRNRDFATLISPSYLSDPDHCPTLGPHGRHLLTHDDVRPKQFLRAAGLSTGVSIAGGVLLALLSLKLYKHAPLGTVRAAAAIQVAIPAAVAVIAFFSSAPAAGIPFAVAAAALAFVLYLYREQLGLVARLLSISVRALSDLPGVIVSALLLQLLGLVLLAPLAGMMLIAVANGRVVPNAARVKVASGMCLDGEGQEVVCCSWQVDSWVPGYLAYAGLVTTWTTLLVFTVKLFTISGATAQWYFAPAGVGAPKGATLRSARHALGPAFGSLCLASWLLTLIQYARAALQKMREQNEGGFCGALLASCLDMIYALFEAISKFGVVRAAITGEPFIEACRGVVDLLARNALDTVGVWFLPGFILQTTSAMTAVAWGVLSYGGASAYWGGGEAAGASAAIVGVLSGFFALVTMAFLNGVLLNMIDATYVAWAMDRDAAAVTRSDVHDVFGRPDAPWVKAPGAVIENPEGGYAYGAETAPHAPQPYPGTHRG